MPNSKNSHNIEKQLYSNKNELLKSIKKTQWPVCKNC